MPPNASVFHFFALLIPPFNIVAFCVLPPRRHYGQLWASGWSEGKLYNSQILLGAVKALVCKTNGLPLRKRIKKFLAKR